MNNTTEKLGLRILELNEKLQAEIQRADKAEEMVESFKQGGVKDVINIYESRIKELQLRIHQEQTKTEEAQAFRQKLCDEIVGKIEASRSQVMEHTPCTDHIGFDNSIEIVKSVLSGEE